jgi:UDP-N-acetylglucosamine--N-acetylmuramyl-(pentapeptide) pyrophosphoryl-undecaprenol N-acetylglucosamine transferase
VYPALAVLERLNDEYPDAQVLWIGSEGGMEAELVTQAGIDFLTIPAAGIHGVGIRRLPRNIIQIVRGIFAARGVINRFNPTVMFFTGGYVAVPMALAGLRIPALLFVPDIEPGLALKFLALFADKIAISVDATRKYFSNRAKLFKTGYPTRLELSSCDKQGAYKYFGFTPDLPTLLVTGGSLGSLAINQALVKVLPELLGEMQIIHLTGKLTWAQFSEVKPNLTQLESVRYQSFPYLHEEMGAALTIADLVVSRAGASSIGEYPIFGIPAILVPYPHAWQYQKVNADYLVKHGAAVVLDDSELDEKLALCIKNILRDEAKLIEMEKAMHSLASHDAAKSIADLIYGFSTQR